MTMQPKYATICIGVSGSGKSTFASDLVEKHGYVEVNRDNIRFADNNGVKDWDNYEFTNENEAAVTVEWDRQLDTAMSGLQDIVISDTNLNVDRRFELFARLHQAGYTVELKVFDVSFDKILKRNAKREHGLPYEALLSQHIRLQREMLKLPADGIEFDSGLPKAYICDLDSTIYQAVRRDHSDMGKVLTDVEIPHVVAIVKGLLTMGYPILFLTGRYGVAERLSKIALEETFGEAHLWDVNELHCREEGDHRKDSEFKRQVVLDDLAKRYNIVGAIDDRKEVIENGWNVLGIPVINVGDNWRRY